MYVLTEPVYSVLLDRKCFKHAIKRGGVVWALYNMRNSVIGGFLDRVVLRIYFWTKQLE